jgi:hypothetical protein
VNLRRHFAFLERSIDRGLKLAVFESNGSAPLRERSRSSEHFLVSESRVRHLLGFTPKRRTRRLQSHGDDQNNIDNERLIGLVGVSRSARGSSWSSASDSEQAQVQTAAPRTNGAVCGHPADSRRAIELDETEQPAGRQF